LIGSILLTHPALAEECPADSTCVPPEDMHVFVTLLREKKCQQETSPAFVLDPVVIITDKDGRVFTNGGQPRPYTIRMHWCGYDVTGTGQVDVVAARIPEPSWGWRFRVKAALGVLLADLVSHGTNGLDGGLLLEPFFFRWTNVNGYVGVRSVGGGFGFDLTRNFGLYAGYATTWNDWQHNPHVSAYFSFW
jgi:hypothetical protein